MLELQYSHVVCGAASEKINVPFININTYAVNAAHSKPLGRLLAVFQRGGEGRKETNAPPPGCRAATANPPFDAKPRPDGSPPVCPSNFLTPFPKTKQTGSRSETKPAGVQGPAIRLERRPGEKRKGGRGRQGCPFLSSLLA